MSEAADELVRLVEASAWRRVPRPIGAYRDDRDGEPARIKAESDRALGKRRRSPVAAS